MRNFAGRGKDKVAKVGHFVFLSLTAFLRSSNPWFKCTAWNRQFESRGVVFARKNTTYTAKHSAPA
jgi:hypothetical protein